MPIEEGTRLGPYVVQDVLGQGAMGVVYRAYHAQLERTGAVKVMHGLTPDEDSVARFRHEAQAIAQMRHPNILNVFDFGDFEGTPYMIVEYVPGGSLATLLKGAPLQPSVALGYLRGIAAGLDHAHSLSIVHRDIKPANVLMEKDGTPVLADFGLVKLLQGSSVRSLTGVTTGTPAYMAPEQVMGHHVGPPADRYSLATIAYEMLTGAIPFDGEGVMEVLYAQVHREPPAPSTRRPELGPAVDAVIMRGLAKDPEARWETCTDFVDALAVALAAPVPAPVEQTVAVSPPAPPRRATRKAVERTEIMMPPLAATVPVAIASPPLDVPSPWPDGSLGPKPPKPRRRVLPVTGAIALILLLLLAMGICAIAANRPTLAVNPTIVAAGGTVIVTASQLPANQVGEIQLHSEVQVFAFRASGSGTVDEEMTIPSDTDVGDHIVRLCWASSCRLQANLTVVAAGTVLPSPAGSSPTPSPSASPSVGLAPTPTGRRSTPSPSTRAASSPTPTHGPSPIPTRSPSPSPVASPTPCTPVGFFVPSVSKLNGFTATYRCFLVGTTWTVTLWVKQLGTWKSYALTSATIGGATYYSKKYNTPVPVLAGQSAYVQTCRSGSGCYTSSTVTVGV